MKGYSETSLTCAQLDYCEMLAREFLKQEGRRIVSLHLTQLDRVRMADKTRALIRKLQAPGDLRKLTPFRTTAEWAYPTATPDRIFFAQIKEPPADRFDCFACDPNSWVPLRPRALQLYPGRTELVV